MFDHGHAFQIKSLSFQQDGVPIKIQMKNVSLLSSKFLVVVEGTYDSQRLIHGSDISKQTRELVTESLAHPLHNGDLQIDVIEDKGWIINTTVVVIRVRLEGRTFSGFLIHPRLRVWYFDELEFWTTMTSDELMAVGKEYRVISRKHGILFNPSTNRDLMLITAFLTEVDQIMSSPDFK